MAPRAELLTGGVYGVVNGLMVLPVMISFTSIIYRDPVFVPFLPTLVKLTLFSAAVHQLCFASFSSMVFAVGQVQDAGLIFLAAMASSIVSYAQEHGHDQDTMISTVVVLLSGSTLLLGLALMAVGRLRLASYVQYLPMPVVGGYLAFIGVFCGESGMAMMAGIEVSGVSDWPKFLDRRAATLILPGVVLGTGLYWAVRNVRHMLTLPVCMATIIAGFYLILALTGTSLADARELGWVAEEARDTQASEAWHLFRFHKVCWGVAPYLFFNWLAMFFVVAFSSSLDVAAIEMELGTPLDYNRELMTVGISNLASGASGGYTGSYIFSQTIFNLRVGVRSRLTGYTVAVIELIVFVLPFSLVSFVPKCFFGSLLTLIAVDLCYEWLVEARKKMARAEYIVCLATFAAVNYLGVEGGMLVGIILSMASFTYSYARLPAVKTSVRRTSLITRTFQERMILDKAMHNGLMQVFTLQGYIFFGSAVDLLADVKERIKWPADAGRAEGSGDGPLRPLDSLGRSTSSPNLDADFDPANPHATTSVAAMPVYNRGGGATPATPRRDRRREAEAPGNRRARSNSVGTTPTTERSPLIPDKARAQTIVAAMPVYNRGGGPSAPSPARADGPPGARAASVPGEGSPLGGMAQRRGSRSHEAAAESTPFLRAREAGAPLGYGASDLAGERDARGKYGRPPVSRALADMEAGALGMPLESPGSYRGELVRVPSEAELSPAREASVATFGVKSWVIFDFEMVNGIDATAARACFLILRKLLQSAGVQVVYAGVPEHVKQLLNAHGVIDEAEDPLFDSVEEALEWCEERLLNLGGLGSRSRSALSVSSSAADLAAYKEKVRGRRFQRLHQKLSQDDPWEGVKQQRAGEPPGEPSYNLLSFETDPNMPPATFPSSDDLFLRGGDCAWTDLRALLFECICDYNDAAVGALLRTWKEELDESALRQYFQVQIVQKGVTLFERGEASSRLYVCRQGEVELLAPTQDALLDLSEPAAPYRHDAARRPRGAMAPPRRRERRIQKISDGGMCGEVGFFLCRPQDFRAVTCTHCQLWYMTRESLATMYSRHPTLTLLLQHAILRSLSLSISENVLPRQGL